MGNHYREEIPIPNIDIPGSFEWWTIGIDTDGKIADCFASYGGIRQNDLPIAVLNIAIPKWAEWLGISSSDF